MLDYLSQLPDSLVIMEMDEVVHSVPANAFLELDPVSGVKDPMTKKIGQIYRKIKELEIQFLAYPDPLFNPKHPTLNIGLVRTQKMHVFLSGSCHMPQLSAMRFMKKWMQDLKDCCQEVGAEFRITDYKRPYRTEEQSPFVKGS